MYVTAPSPSPTRVRPARRAVQRRLVRSGEVGGSRPAQLASRILDVADALDRTARGVNDAATDYDVEPTGIRMRRDTIGMLDALQRELAAAMADLEGLRAQPWGEHALLLADDMVRRPLAEMADAFARRGDGYSRHRSIEVNRSLVVSSASAIADGLREVVVRDATA